ncbi:MAG: BatA and WFA domain-containing protein [Lentisphaerales bacterium]|nr:BatA and WFA domain-containing protein [Lentisphaerales bacterium]
MKFNLPSAAWFFFLIIPLVAFYFLKLRRQRVQIPSLVLWQQVLQDSRVNSPFQKFKRNLLLLLQLLLLCLLILAAMDPIVSGNTTDLKLPIIVDCSASMGTLEKGQSRLAKVKEKLNEIIKNKDSDQEFAIISFAKTAQKLCSFTNNYQILQKAVDDLKITDLESDLESALKVTQALTKSGKFGEALLFTDGNLQDVPTFDLSFQLNVQLIGETDSKNIGISQLSATRAGPTSWVIFVQLTASESYTATATVNIFQNSDKIASDSFSTIQQKQQRLSFKIDGSQSSLLKVELQAGEEDSLAADNQAWMDLTVARPLDVYVASNLGSIRTVLQNIPGLQINDQPAEKYDLAIFSHPTDHAINAKTKFSVGYIPEDLSSLIETENSQSTIIDWNRSNELLQHVTLDDLLLMQSFKMTNANRPLEVEKKSYEVLITGEQAPLLLKKKIADLTPYYCLFNPDQSTLPYKVAFPILLTNLINESLRNAGLAEKEATKTGYLHEVAAQKEKTYTLRLPSGKQIEIKPDSSGIIGGTSAPISGAYEFSLHQQTVRTIYASLLSPLESSLTSLNSIQFNETSVTASDAETLTDKPLWRYLAAIAFGLLLLEWWFYQKRARKILT